MQYRTMPKSTDKLSVLGFGCMRLPAKSGSTKGSAIDKPKAAELIKAAIDQGVNYLDTAWFYHLGASEPFLGEYILSTEYRSKVFIATKLPCYIINRTKRMEEIFNKQLERLRVDFIDYYLLHSIDGTSWDKMLDLGVIPFMNKIKREKKIRHMGFSFHGNAEDFKRIIDAYDWDFAQVQYNIIDENFQAGISGIQYAAERGIGIIVMEPLRGGELVGRIPKPVKTIYDSAPVKRSAADWGLRWIYNQPEVTLVLSGMNDIAQIEENIKTASDAQPNSLSQVEIDTVTSVRDAYLKIMKVGCTGCGYCMPCPAGINIPDVFKRYNNYHMRGKFQAKLGYMAFEGILVSDGRPHWTSSCIDCGQCEKACPQHIAVRKTFEDVRKEMEGPVIKAAAAAARVITGRNKKPGK